MKTPKLGYILPKWKLENEMRATALAYLQRENLRTVENVNGKAYTVNELKESIINDKIN